MEAVYKSGGKVAFTEQGLVLDKPSAVILKVAPEQITKSTRVGNDLVLTLVDGTQIYVNGFFAAYAEEGRNDLVLEDQQGVLWWGQYGGAWEGFEFTEIESNESVAAWLPWLVGLGLGGLAVSSGGSGGGGKNVNNPPEPIDPNEGLSPGASGHVPGQEFSNGGYKVTVREDQPFNGKVVGQDSDGDSLTYGLGTPPAHGTVTIDKNTGEYTYTPNKDWSGPGTDSFEVIVDDGKGGKTTTTVTVNVGAEQDAYDDIEGTGFGKSVTVDVLGNDKFAGHNVKITQVDGKAITEGGAAVALTDGSGSVKLVGGQLEFTPKAGFVGDAKFSYTAQTDGGTPEQANVTVTVAANQLPEPTDPNAGLDPQDPNYVKDQEFKDGGYKITVDEDQPFSGKVIGTDKDGDELTYTQGTGPSHGTVTIDKDTGKYTYTPDPDYNGPDEFTVIVDDGKGGKTTTTVTVEFTPEQDVADDTATTGYDKPVSIDVLGNDDFEGANVTITQVDGKAITEGGAAVALTDGSGSVKLVGGQLEFTPKAGFVGDAKFSYTAQTDGGTPETANVTVTVAANQLPEPTDPNEGLNPGDPGYVPNQKFDPSTGNYELTTPEDTSVSGKVVGTDVDGDTLTYTEGTPPQHGTVSIDPNTGEYTYTPNKDYNGPDEFTVVVDDGNGGKVTSTVNITVTPVNDDPVFVNPSDDAPVLGYAFEYDENSVAGKVLGQVKATDIDSDLVTYSIDPASNLNGWYAINAVTGEITLTAAGAASYANDFERGGNIHMIKVVATDSDGGKTEVTVTLNELDLNDNAPVWTKDTAVTVSEEGLPDGVQTDPVNPKSAIQTGTILIEDADTVGTQTVTLSAPTEPLTSGGVAVVWSGSGTTDDPLVGKAGGKVIIEASIDNGGHYTVTLKGPVDHPKLPANNGENSLELNLKVTVSDGVHTDTGKLTVTIGDGIPVAEPTESDYVLPTQNTNLLLILDVSGSMRNLDGGTKTRMQIMQEAVKMMLDSYGALGDVAVRIVIFGSGAATHGSQWESIASAKAYVDSLTTSGMPNGINGATHHSTALTEAMSAFQTSAGKISGGNNVAYLLTDGASTPNYEIKTALENQWKTFLTDNQMNSMAFGISPGAAGTEPNINPAAYDGRTGDDTDAVMVPDTAKLPPILRDSVGVNTSGSVTSGGLLGESDWGADGGSVDSITVNGRVYHADGTVTGGTSNGTWNSTTHTWTINTEGTGGDINKGGKLVINMDDGSYTYVPPLIATGTTHVENIGFELIDADGDKAGSDLTLTVHPAGTVLPSPAPAAFAMSAGLGLEHLDALATDADDPAALPALHDVLQPQTAADEAGGNIAGLGSADAPAAPAAPVAAPQDLALYMPAPLPEEELHQPVHV